jgi:glutamate-5-semialdehyde dehydrogenase
LVFLSEVGEKAVRARDAARRLARVPVGIRNKALLGIAAELVNSCKYILDANAVDMEAGRAKGLSRALLDRLMLTPDRVEEMAAGVKAVAALPDPLGTVDGMWTLANGLSVGRVRVPLGVIGIIYEARPNVTVDAACLCLKAGSAVILRGGSEAFRSNLALAQVLVRAALDAGLPEGAIGMIETTDRSAVEELMKQRDCVDVIIPRGGAGLIASVVNNSTVPVIETGTGNCHVYVDEGADLEMARDIVINAKCQRPGVCNAMETLLVHKASAAAFLPVVLEALGERGVEVRGCPATRAVASWVVPAVEEDWATEFLDLVCAVKVVEGMEEAMDHIYRYGSGHSEAIVTRDWGRGRRFLKEVDAAAVYVNASTRFTDGFQFGFGAEIGISTQKLHARGPMGLAALTTYKYVVYGDGQVRS